MLSTKVVIHTPADITLAAHKLWSIEGDRRDTISCTIGSLWITQEADLNDYIVEAGMVFGVTTPGRVVVEALNDAHFKYSRNEFNYQIEDTKQLTNIQRIQA